MSELILVDTQNNVLEYVEIINPTKGALDSSNDMLLLSDNNPIVPNNEQEAYETIAHKVSSISDSGNTVNYPNTKAMVDYFLKYSYYRHIQLTSSTTWNINHNLNKYPSVVTRNDIGKIVIGDVQYIDENNLVVNFNSPRTGIAEIN